MRVLDHDETRALLPFGEVADAVRAVMEKSAAGRAGAPERSVLPLQADDSLLLMPARDPALAIIKLVTVHPANPGRGLPVVQGVVLVVDARTGEPRALLDGAALTARRTPAVSLLAARLLAPLPDGPLWIVGAGIQGRGHLEAIAGELGTREVFVTSASLESAEALVRHARTLGVQARAAPGPETPLREATMIVTATTSTDPVIPAGVREDAFVMAVGAYRPDMRELPAALVQRATIFVDTLEGARAEAGDLIQGLADGGRDWSAVRPLAAAHEPAVRDRAGRASSGSLPGPIVFKSVGHALWDLAAAHVATKKLDAHPLRLPDLR